MFWKKLIYAVAFLTLLAALGAFNKSEASSSSSRVEVHQPGGKFGGAKMLKKQNNRNRKILKKLKLVQLNQEEAAKSC